MGEIITKNEFKKVLEMWNNIHCEKEQLHIPANYEDTCLMFGSKILDKKFINLFKQCSATFLPDKRMICISGRESKFAYTLLMYMQYGNMRCI